MFTVRGRKLKDASGGSGRIRKVLGASLLALFSGVAVHAGEDSLLPIAFGKILFYPSVGFSYAQEENVQRSSEDDPVAPPVSSSVKDIRPMLRFEAPFQRSSTTLSYSPKFRDYGAAELSDAGGTSHYLDFVEQIRITPSFRLNLQDNYLRGITELYEVDPGGELRFGRQPFRQNSAGAAFSLEMGPRQSAEMGGSVSTTRFDATSESDVIYNYRSEGLGARYLLAVGPDTRLFLAVDWRSDSQDRSLEEGGALADYRTRSVGLGLRRGSGSNQTGELRMSYAVIDFPEDPEKRFQGITLEGDLARRLGATVQVALRLNRGPRPSFFNVNSFYLNEMVEVGYSHEIGQRLRVQLIGGFQDNSYPEPVDPAFDPVLSPSEGIRRKDRIRSGTARILCHVARGMELQLEYQLGSARSNMVAERLVQEGAGDPTMIEYRIFDYDYSAVTTSLIVGWQ